MDDVLDGVIGVDMELFGIAKMAGVYNVPVVGVKSVHDLVFTGEESFVTAKKSLNYFFHAFFQALYG